MTLLPLATKRDFNGKTTTYSYDTLNRLLKKTPDASLTRLRSPSRIHPQGSAPRWRTPAVRPLILCTDYRDRLKTKATSEGTLSYTYDAHGNVSTIVSSNPNGASLAYDYDALNRLVTVTDNRLIKQGAAAWETTYTYDPAGNLASYKDPNAVQTTMTYDPLSRLTQVSSVKGSTLASFGYTLGLAGNRTAVAEQGGRAVSYGYDNDYRLISETITGDPMTARNGTVSYGTVSQPGYDQVGNRTQMTSTVSALGTGTTSYSYDADDRLTTDTIDNNGNTTLSGGVSNTYDFENRMTSHLTTTPTTMVYDGDGNRVSESVGGATTKYLVDTLNPTGLPQVLDETVNGAVTRTYAYGLQRISENQLNGSTWTPSFYGYDGHGNVRFLTNTAGTVTDRYQYDAFGRLIASTGNTPNNFEYSGEQFDANVGLYNLRARYYNQATGRFWATEAGARGRTSKLRADFPERSPRNVLPQCDSFDAFVDHLGRSRIAHLYSSLAWQSRPKAK